VHETSAIQKKLSASFFILKNKILKHFKIQLCNQKCYNNFFLIALFKMVSKILIIIIEKKFKKNLEVTKIRFIFASLK